MASGSNTEQAAELLRRSLDQPASTADLARQAFRSRTEFHRWIRAALEETPQAMRRRLLLERAAWQLSRTTARVTDIALDTGYGSLEAFTRAFTRAYGVSPSHFRRIGSNRIELAAPNGIHFYRQPNQGVTNMELFERFAATESWHTRTLIEHAAALSDEQLDRELPNAADSLPYHEPKKSLRQLLENIVYTKEVWAAALLGKKGFNYDFRPAAERTPARLLERLKQADAELGEVYSGVARGSQWDAEFVDALCEPPEKFTYGGVFAHIMTFNAHRRLQALDALRQLGVVTKDYGDPLEFERQGSAK